MHKDLNLLALDLGAESGRAILGKFDGERIKLAEIHRFANSPLPLPDGLHWNTSGLWAEMLNGLGLAAREGTLASMGIDTWGVDFGLLDSQDVLIGNPYHYRDSRTDGVMEKAFAIVPRQEIFAQTGIQFMQLNSLFQLYAMVLNQSPALEIAARFLTMPDLFNFWFTGRKANEFSNATTTQCYNPLSGGWAGDLLRKLDIPAHIFGEIVPPGALLGPLRKPVAEAAGIAPIPVIAPACHDTGSAVAAVPATRESTAWISSGTWSLVGTNVRQPVIDERSLAFNLTNEGGVDGTFRLLKNINGLWLVQEARRTWAAQGEQLSYDTLTQLAEQADALRSLVDPDYEAFFKPGNMPDRIQAYCVRSGQPAPMSKGAVVRCALESLALKYRWVIEKLETLTNRPLEAVHIVGGGSQNRMLSQFTANATGRPVVGGPVEATATGNLLAQAIALGEIGSWAEARQVVCASFEVETFTPQPSAAWDDAYGRFLKLAGEKYA
ncbi:MAG: rhamnulokinase [Chloroflexota bacterium]